MARIGIESGPEGTFVTIGNLAINLTELRNRAALSGKDTKEGGITTDIGTKRRKPGEGQMRWRDGSYLTEAEREEEQFLIDNEIAD